MITWMLRRLGDLALGLLWWRERGRFRHPIWPGDHRTGPNTDTDPRPEGRDRGMR